MVLLNVPNLAGLPYVSGAPLQQKQAAQRASVGMTATINRLASPSVAVLDLMCDARTYQSSSYSADGFHPNDAGYAYLAAEVVRAATSVTYPAPQSRCAAMSIVPAP
jgi:hypothetical protein